MAFGDFFKDAFKSIKKTTKDAFDNPLKGALAVGTLGGSILAESAIEEVGKNPLKSAAAVGSLGTSILAEEAIEETGKLGSSIARSSIEGVGTGFRLLSDAMNPETVGQDLRTSVLDQNEERRRQKAEERQKARQIASRSPGRRQTVLTGTSPLPSLLG